jgi:exodeoxyribonuclease-3
MKIATWNVNSVRARIEHLLFWLKEANPDVVLLQEIKTLPEFFPREEVGDLGYNSLVLGQKSYNGVAILSKHIIEDTCEGLPTAGPHDQEARYVEAFTGGVRVASVYVPNGQAVGTPKFEYKLRFLENLTRHVQTLLTYDEALVIGGDYNIAPTDEDVHDPEKWHEEVMCSTVERKAFQEILKLGVLDALRVPYPEGGCEKGDIYTWWDYRAGSWPKNNGLRIDHLLLSPQAASQFLQAGIDKDMRSLQRPSDHVPVWCQLKEK